MRLPGRHEGDGGGHAAEKTGAVLVVGAGIAGIQASLDLANSGYKVYLVEQSPTIGGTMAQLDKTFPNERLLDVHRVSQARGMRTAPQHRASDLCRRGERRRGGRALPRVA